MKLLYSNILPMSIKEDDELICNNIHKQIRNSNGIEIAVGYASKASLIELNKLVEENAITNITLIIGMYYIEGMPESIYHTAIEINEKWQGRGLGEIRLVKAFKYHGKVYCFFHDGIAETAVIGSANLGVMKLEANNRRQYEISVFTDDEKECKEIEQHISDLKSPGCSENISAIEDINLIREVNTSLNNVDTVEQIPATEVARFEQCKTDISFKLPLKVPAKDERHIDDGKHYTKSNLNVCYAAPRNARKARDWYETQLTVSKKITRQEGYPVKNAPFFVATDDGYWFKVHTTSDGNKQFSAVGNELIMGRWIKGRLAAAGLVAPINNTGKDIERLGMITKEMLAAYGRDTIVLTKTDKRASDENGELLDVWIFSFETMKEEE